MKLVREFPENIPVTFGAPWPVANPEKAMKDHALILLFGAMVKRIYE